MLKKRRSDTKQTIRLHKHDDRRVGMYEYG